MNPLTKEEYVEGNITEAQAIFSLSDSELEVIAEAVIAEVDQFFAAALAKEQPLDGDGDLQALKIYRRDIQRYPEIGFAETVALARSIESDNSLSQKARESLICTYLPWAYRVATKLAVRYRKFLLFDVLDLIQEASLGLIEAVDKWEKAKTRGARLITFASRTVSGRVLDFLREHGSPGLKVPRRVQEVWPKVKWILDHWKRGESPTVDDLAKLCGVSRKTMVIALAGMPVLESQLEWENKDGKTQSPLGQLFKDARTPESKVLLYLQAKSILQQVREAIDSFAADNLAEVRDKEILLLALDFDGLGMTAKEIGKAVGLTESRVCQIIGDFLDYLELRDIQVTGKGNPRKPRFPEARRNIRAMQEVVDNYEEA